MVELKVKRIFKGATYTIGHLYINGVKFCDTLEDTDRGLNQSMSDNQIAKIKIKDKTAIPTGTYTVNMNTVSPRFGKTVWAKKYNGIVPRLMKVPGYEGVLIHPGNTSENTSGCLLVGLNKIKGQVVESQKTWLALMEKIYNKGAITLTIE